ncbi:N-acetyltransferase family protein [Balneola sp. MJW-20]|uniref:GNAT family N-acetyltransferase n=1 Tax=Gracilimonas aurantiaca TaxID=3234185 RepID=UPI0034668D37
MLRSVMLRDAKEICDIYNGYVLSSRATFEEEPVSVSDMKERIRKITQNYPWLVFEEGDHILGYTYATRWKERSAYRYTVETASYVHKDHHNKGIGSALKSAMIEELKKTDVHAILSGITMPNDRSIALNEKFGFTKVAHLKEVGFKFGEWIDVGYWQLILNS